MARTLLASGNWRTEDLRRQSVTTGGGEIWVTAKGSAAPLGTLGVASAADVPLQPSHQVGSADGRGHPARSVAMWCAASRT